MHAVEVLPEAEYDIVDAYGYYLEKDERVADEFLNGISKAAQNLSQYPLMGSESKIKRLARRGFREYQVVYNFVAYYKLEFGKVLIYRVLDTRRDTKSIVK